jgi:hypothetical protein
MTDAGIAQMSNLKKEDIVIALMGVTGSGKSTLVSLLSDGPVRIGHELTSCKTTLSIASEQRLTIIGTAEIEIHSFIYKDTRRVYLIDTPGFDDTHRTGLSVRFEQLMRILTSIDTDVLKQLAFWLGETYKNNTVQLSGIIYLHRITDDRMSGSSLRNLTTFKKLCGENAFQYIKLATTMWKNLNGPNLSYDTGVAREKELTSRKDWWGMMCERGSSVVRHDGTKECALEMIEDLIQRRAQGGPVLLEIQKEMVDDKKSLEDTAAGQEVEKELTLAKKKFEEQLTDIQESYDEALKERDMQLAEVLKEQRDDLEKKLQKAGEAQENLKITFEKLCEEKTAEYAVMVHELQEEKRQRQAEYAARQSELDRLQEEQEKDVESHRKEREMYERQREEAEQRMHDMLKAQKTTEAERAKDETEKLDKKLQQMEEVFATERKQQQQHAEALQAQLQQMQQAKPSKKETSLMPIITLLAGLTTSGIGLLTLNPAAVVAGIGTALDGLSGGNGGAE